MEYHHGEGAAATMIRIRLSTLLGERRWTQTKFAKLAGLRAATVNEYYNELVRNVSLDTIDSMCKALGCQVGDLLVREPDTEE